MAWTRQQQQQPCSTVSTGRAVLLRCADLCLQTHLTSISGAQLPFKLKPVHDGLARFRDST